MIYLVIMFIISNFCDINNTYQRQSEHTGTKSMRQNKAQLSSSNFWPYYTLEKRVIVKDTGLFKIKKFDDNHIIFSAPEMKQVVKTDLQLNKVVETYNYEDNPSSIDVVQLSGHKFIVAGCHSGNIIVKPSKQQNLQQNEQSKQQMKQKQASQWKYKPNSGQVYANDIVHLPKNQSIVINCYNNGNIAVWGLLSNKRLHTFQRVHEKYTYKLRIQSENILISCGNDCSIVRTDLQTQQQLQSLNHPMPVWCAHPVNQNQIASVGLFGRTLVWDVRSNRVVQFCNNDGNQSSFVTTRNKTELKLFYGDANMIIKWDRRKSKPQLLTNHMMQISSQALLFHNHRLYACGRGKDLCVLKGSNTNQTLTHFNQTQLTHILELSKKKQNQIKSIEGYEQIQVQMDDEESWRSSGDSEDEMEDQSQPLIKEHEISKTWPIEAVAGIKIEDLKNMKQYQQHWLINQKQDSSSEEQIEQKNIIPSNQKYEQYLEQQNQKLPEQENKKKTIIMSSQCGKKQTKSQINEEMQKQK